MKKQLSLLLAAGMTAGLLAGCGGATSSTATASAATSTASEATGETTSEATDITMWTYPIGQFGDADTVNSMIAKFQETHPEINVTVEYLDYTNGDDQVTAAIEAGTTPDIVMEGPERLVSNWGAKGKMLDLSDLWTEEATADISAVSESVVSACKGADGKYYEYPLCMTTHTMAINKEMFEEAGALQYINEDGTWTTENFEKALQALKDNGVDTTMIVYCGGQGGPLRCAGPAGPVDGRDRPGSGRDGAHLQPTAHPGGRRRQRPERAADPASGTQGESGGHARLCRGTDRYRRGAAERRRAGGRRLLPAAPLSPPLPQSTKNHPAVYSGRVVFF